MRQIIFFDLETTGIPVWGKPSESDGQPHIVELAALVVDEDTRTVIQGFNVIVKPETWVIPQETTDIHGITNAHAMDVGIPEHLVLDVFLAMWNGRLRVAHNTTFDNRIIRIAIKRYCSRATADAWKESQYMCTGLLAKPIMKMPLAGKRGDKMPKLSEAYLHFTGKELEGQHTAMADVRACMAIYFAVKDRG